MAPQKSGGKGGSPVFTITGATSSKLGPQGEIWQRRMYPKDDALTPALPRKTRDHIWVEGQHPVNPWNGVSRSKVIIKLNVA